LESWHTAFLGEGRDAETDDFAVVLGHDADLGIDDGLLDDA
jgi:prolyl oligopeptidase PreP (S9A serine peptidase family)